MFLFKLKAVLKGRKKWTQLDYAVDAIWKPKAPKKAYFLLEHPPKERFGSRTCLKEETLSCLLSSGRISQGGSDVVSPKEFYGTLGRIGDFVI